jgi:branched-subunit amino acid aminotransferase/4-amino-4-deoxychorismate lyase
MKVKNIMKNGKFILEKDAHVSISDRSFRFGDGCFETIPFYDRKIFRKKDHLNRLKNALKYLKIELDIKDISRALKKMIMNTPCSTGFFRVICSRGEGSCGYLPKNAEPVFYIDGFERNFERPKKVIIGQSQYLKIETNQIPVNVKLNSNISSVLSRIEAEEQNLFENILLTKDGYISECSSSNIGWFKDDTLYFPSEKCSPLEGITQKVVEEISSFKIEKGEYSLEELISADEVILLNSNWEILSVDKFEKKKYQIKHANILREEFYKKL